MTAILVIAPYFKEISLEVLLTFMEYHGFEYQKNDDSQGVFFNKNSLAIEVSYWPEDFPDYQPCVDIGFIEDGLFSSVGLWEALPETSDVHYSSWRFRDADELRMSLLNLRDRVLSVHGPLLWADSHSLKNVIAKHVADLKANYQKGFRKETKMKAEKAFRDGNYSEAISLYSKLSSTDLSPVEVKRIEIIKKRMGIS